MTLPILPGFLHAGFECSTHRDRNLRQDRRDFAYAARSLRPRGLPQAAQPRNSRRRDGVRWNVVDRRGRLDFSSALPFIEAAEEEGIVVIWDLFHYGYPDDLHPFDPNFIPRFASYCYGFARLMAAHSRQIPFYTPVNEISFFAWAGADGDLFAPRVGGRGDELKRLLVRAAIAGMEALLAVDPRAGSFIATLWFTSWRRMIRLIFAAKPNISTITSFMRRGT